MRAPGAKLRKARQKKSKKASRGFEALQPVDDQTDTKCELPPPGGISHDTSNACKLLDEAGVAQPLKQEEQQQDEELSLEQHPPLWHPQMLSNFAKSINRAIRLREVSDAFLAALLWSVCSVGMTVLNKLALSEAKAPFGILMVQMLFACVAVIVKEGRRLRFGHGTLRWTLSVPPLFVLMLCSSMLALQHVSIGAFVVVRNLGPVIMLAVEVALHSPTGLVCDGHTIISLASLVVGVLVYQMEKIEWPGPGITFLLLNLVVSCAERMVQRHLLAVHKVDVSKQGLVLLNNAIGFALVAIVAAFVPGEYARTWAAASEADLRSVLLCASAAVGLGISYSGIWLQSLVTATSFMVLGCFCKAAIVLFGILTLGDASSPTALLGAGLSLAGCVSYSIPGSKTGQMAQVAVHDDLDAAPGTGVGCSLASVRHRISWGILRLLCLLALSFIGISIRVADVASMKYRSARVRASPSSPPWSPPSSPPSPPQVLPSPPHRRPLWPPSLPPRPPPSCPPLPPLPMIPPLLPPPPPQCFIRFHKNMFGREGIADISGKLAAVMGLASTWGCAAAVPRPHAVLRPSHNGGRQVDGSLWWDHYFTINQTLLKETVPSGAPVDWLSDVVPTDQYMRQWLQRRVGHGPAPVLELSYPERWFYGDLDSEFSARWDAAMAARVVSGPVFQYSQVSALVHDIGRNIATSLFGNGTACPWTATTCATSCVHLRRGDRTQQYPTGCSDVDTVAWNALNNFQAAGEPPQPETSTNVFVMTDERNASYLSRLRTALGRSFDTVRFEGDFDWQQHQVPNDNYLRVLALGDACTSLGNWKTRLNFHPDSLCNSRGRQLHKSRPQWLLARERRVLDTQCIRCSM